MRAEDGSYEGPMTGRYIEIVPPTRLVFEITEHCNGAPHLFDATKLPTTTVTIELRAWPARKRARPTTSCRWMKTPFRT